MSPADVRPRKRAGVQPISPNLGLHAAALAGMVWTAAAGTGLAWAAPIQGRALERGTSRPLVDVEIRCVGPAAPACDGASATTGPDGRFTLDLPEGDGWVLRGTGPDHRPVEAMTPSPATEFLLFFEPADPGYEVVVESFRPTSNPTVHRVDAEQAWEAPGTQEDSVRLVQSLPGVTVQREFSPTSGDLSVRGSAPGDNRYFLDGIEIPYLYHFNQYASVFPTGQIGRLDLFPSTFGSRYGDAVGAVVEAESRTDPPTDLAGQVSLNTIMAGLDLRAPVGRGWWLAAAGRRSYQDLYSSGSDQYQRWPVFHDLALRAERGDKLRGTGLFLVTAGDGYERSAGELDLLDPLEAEQSPTFRYRRGFQVFGVRHRWSRDTSDGRWVTAIVHDDLLGILRGQGEHQQRNVSLNSRLDLSHIVDPGGSKVSLGFELRGGITDLRVAGAGPAGIAVQAEAPALGRTGGDVDTLVPRLEAGAYGEVMIVAGDFRIFPGFRVGVDTLTGALLPEPRLATRWQIADQSAIKLAGGRYLQTPSILDLTAGPGNPDLPLTRSWQVGGGLEQTFARRLELNVDGYARFLEDMLVPRPDAVPDVAPVGRAVGLEVVSRYRLRDLVFLWTWAGISRTQYREGQDDSWKRAATDQPVNLGLVLSWDPNPKWNLAFRWRYGSGLPWTPVDGSVYDADRDAWDPVLADPWSARMPAYTKFDIAAGRTWTFTRWSLQIRAEAWIVPRSANVLYPTWSDDWSEQGWVRGIPILPLLGGRARF